MKYYKTLILLLLIISGKVYSNNLTENKKEAIETLKEQEELIDQQNLIIEKEQQNTELQNKLNKRDNYKTIELTSPKQQNTSQQCFEIKQIKIDKTKLLSQDKLTKITKKYENDCLTTSDINKLIKDITKLYLDKGYITSRAGINLGTSLTKGILTISLLEGKIEKININFYNNNFANQQKKKAFPLQSKDFLNIYSIEQGLENINSLNSQKTTMQIKPSSTAGFSNIDVDIKQIANPFEIYLSTNNQVSDITGRSKTIGLHLEDLAIKNSKFNFSFSDASKKSPHNHRINYSRAVNYNYKIPYGWWDFDYSLKLKAIKQQIKGRIQVFESSNSSTTNQFDFTRLILRNKKNKLSIGLNLEFHQTSSYINDAKIYISSRDTLDSEIQIKYLRFLSSGYLTTKLIFGKGLDYKGSTKDKKFTESTPKIKYELYKIISKYHTIFKLFDQNFNYSLNIKGQSSPSELLNKQSCKVGGYGSIGGFSNSLIEENCFIANNKLNFNPIKNDYLKFLNFGVSLDYGISQSHYKPRTYTLIGGGYFFNYSNQYLEIKYDNSYPLNKPSIFKNRKKKDNQLIFWSLKFKYDFNV